MARNFSRESDADFSGIRAPAQPAPQKDNLEEFLRFLTSIEPLVGGAIGGTVGSLVAPGVGTAAGAGIGTAVGMGSQGLGNFALNSAYGDPEEEANKQLSQETERAARNQAMLSLVR